MFINAKFIIKNIKFCLMLFFIPLLPGSGIFNAFNGIMFWLIFSLTNSIYENKKKITKLNKFSMRKFNKIFLF